MHPLEILGLNPKQALATCLSPMPVAKLIELSRTGQMNWLALDYYYFSNCLRKHPQLLGEPTLDKTIGDFFAAEQRAGEYNAKFEALLKHPELYHALTIWRNHVQSIMGKVSYGRSLITSGATTTSAKGQNPIDRFKQLAVSAELERWFEDNPSGLATLPGDYTKRVVGIAKFAEAPKTAFIGRAIITPLVVNSFEQKRSGLALVQRLKRVGINFEVSQEVHRRLASFASVRNHLTTDDQKWASPLIYTSLVKFLISREWFNLLSASRDYQVEMPDGSIHTLQQFAGTGNGYCFELETIIFLGLLRTAATLKGFDVWHKDIKVFGDDLIYPKELTAAVRSIGKAVGFITNVDKSYAEGPFRESCGGDYLDGMQVRPIYLKQDFNSPYGLTLMANQCYELYLRHGRRLPLMYKVWKRLIRQIYKIGGRKSVLRGPRHLECLHGTLPGSWTFTSKKHSSERFLRVWVNAPVKTISFRELVYGCTSTYASEMITGGYVRGYGSIIPYVYYPKWFVGPPVKQEPIYPRIIPAPGTSYRPKIVTRQFFAYPPLVDVDDPLKVFDILPLTRNRNSRLLSTDYVRDTQIALTIERLNLIDTLKALVASRRQFIDDFDVSDIVIEI